MAVLTDSERTLCSADMQVAESTDSQALGLIKADLRAAVNAIDDWIQANQASFNSAIPLPARTALTARQKSRLLMLALQRRYGAGL